MAPLTRLLSSSTGTECAVPCLQNLVDMLEECEMSSIKLSQDTRQFMLYQMLKKLGHHQSQKLITKFIKAEIQEWKDDYEVESILDHCRDAVDGQMYYLIKWVDWDSQYNTWEPEDNLSDCQDMLTKYHSLNVRNRKRKWSKPEDNGHLKRQRFHELFHKLIELKVLDSVSPLQIIKSYCAEKRPHINGTLAHLKPRFSRKISKKALKLEAVKALKVWQDELNRMVKGYDPAPIFVENKVDLEGPPDNFIYINERKEGPGVVIPKDPLIGCDCEDCYENRKHCCVVASGSVLAYYKSNGRLKVPKGVPIYECNVRCKCGPSCLNRVAQKGRRVKVCIFRTANGRGWGVKTLQNIKKGAFVMEYVGEVITNEEAERRGKDYDSVGRTYLFDLDFHDADATYTVDAGTFGNAAHFINHSCNPNLEVFVVWINTLDPQLPHICLYAKRDIEKNEELTFDYMSGNSTFEDVENVPVQQGTQDSAAGTEASLTQTVEAAKPRLPKPDAPEEVNNNAAGVLQVNVDGNLPSPDSPSKLAAESHQTSSDDSCQQDGETAKLCDEPSLDESSQQDGEAAKLYDEPSLDESSQLDGTAPPSLEVSFREDGSSLQDKTEKSKFSMACLCGASNCRKFLFF